MDDFRFDDEGLAHALAMRPGSLRYRLPPLEVAPKKPPAPETPVENGPPPGVTGSNIPKKDRGGSGGADGAQDGAGNVDNPPAGGGKKIKLKAPESLDAPARRNKDHLDTALSPREKKRLRQDQNQQDDVERGFRKKNKPIETEKAPRNKFEAEETGARNSQIRGDRREGITTSRRDYAETHDYWLDKDGTVYALVGVDEKGGWILRRDEGDPEQGGTQRFVRIGSQNFRRDEARVVTGTEDDRTVDQTFTRAGPLGGPLGSRDVQTRSTREDDGVRVRRHGQRFDGEGALVGERRGMRFKGDAGGTHNVITDTDFAGGKPTGRTRTEQATDALGTIIQDDRAQTYFRNGVAYSQVGTRESTGTLVTGAQAPSSLRDHTTYDRQGQPLGTFTAPHTVPTYGTTINFAAYGTQTTFTVPGDDGRKLQGGGAVTEEEYLNYVRTGKPPAGVTIRTFPVVGDLTTQRVIIDPTYVPGQ